MSDTPETQADGASSEDVMTLVKQEVERLRELVTSFGETVTSFDDRLARAEVDSSAAKGMADSLQFQLTQLDRVPDIVTGFGGRLSVVEQALAAEGKPVRMPEKDEAHETRMIGITYTCATCGCNQEIPHPGNREYAKEKPCPVCAGIQKASGVRELNKTDSEEGEPARLLALV